MPRTTDPMLLGIAFFLLLSPQLSAQTSVDPRNLRAARPHDRVMERIDDRERIVLAGNRHPLAQPQFEAGVVSPEQQMERMVLVLRPDAAQEKALDDLIRSQQDPASPLYHQWLTPEVFGEHFGISRNDLDEVVGWLEMNGMEVNEIPASQRAIVFSGTANQVETAFHTPMRKYFVRGQTHFANAGDPEIPHALAQVVRGVVSLHDFGSVSSHVAVTPALTNSNGAHFLAPADWDTIYDVGLLYNQGLDGAGQSIAVVGRADIALSDVRTFRSNYGLPANDPQIIINGTDPGFPNGNDEAESTLDVEWAGAVAKKATVKFVTSKSGATDGIVLSAQYAVTHNTAPIVSVSYILCEASLGSSGNAFWNGLWAQAASQGQSVFVSSGDAGAAGCDSPNTKSATRGKAVNGMCSSPYSTCVGGTEFDDNYNPGTYWSAANGSGGASVLSYIPELAWDESAWSGGLWSSGGGVSTLYTKPTWQSAPGVPNDGKRDVPDVSMAAAIHDAYVVQFQNKINYFAGTSVAAPSLASVMALVLQNIGRSQGNINPVLYALAQRQLSSGGAPVFHDTRGGNNSVPGVLGYNAGVGYDLATGLGSVDASVLVSHWNDASASDFVLSTSSSSISVSQGGSNAVTLTMAAQGGFKSPITLSASGAPGGVTVTFSPSTLTAGARVTATVSAGLSPVAGNYTLTISGTGGGLKRTLSLTLTVVASSFTLTNNAASASVAPGASVAITVSTAVVNGFKSTVALSVRGLPNGVTASFAPASVTSPGSGSSRLTLTAASGTIAGVSTLTVTGTGAGVTKTQTLALTVLASSFTLTPGATSASVAPGGSMPITVSTAAVNGFKSAVALSVSGLRNGVTASFAPASIASPGSGSSKLTLTVASGTAAGVSTLTVTGTGGGVTKTQTLTLTVATPPSLALTAAAASISVTPGRSIATKLSTAGLNGFKSAIAFSVIGLPKGITATFAPASIASPGTGSSTLTLAAASGAATGASTLTLTATGGGVAKTQTLKLTVASTTSARSTSIAAIGHAFAH